MEFPRLFSRVVRITPRHLYWSVSELDTLDDTTELSEFMNWRAFHRLKAIKPSHLVRFYVQGAYREEIGELFKKHKQFKQIIAADERREKRARKQQKRGVG